MFENKRAFISFMHKSVLQISGKIILKCAKYGSACSKT